MQSSISPHLLNPESALLLIVDIQEKFAAALTEFDRIVDRTGILIQACSKLNVPILVSEQYPKGLGHTAGALKKLLPLNTPIFEKSAFGCGQDPDIYAYLSSLTRKQVMVCGLESHVCINQTVHHLLSHHYQTHLIQDAITSRHPRDHQTAIAKMQQSGAIPSSVEMALFELLGSAQHPCFKQVQALVK
jgi:nicotinamidase-related amidase